MTDKIHQVFEAVLAEIYRVRALPIDQVMLTVWNQSRGDLNVEELTSVAFTVIQGSGAPVSKSELDSIELAFTRLVDAKSQYGFIPGRYDPLR
jgi:hypothetical protein